MVDRPRARFVRRRADLLALPTTATPRASAVLTGGLLLACAVAVPLSGLRSGDGPTTGGVVLALVAGAAGLLGLVLLRRRTIGRAGVHAVLLSQQVVLACLVLAAPPGALGTAFGSVYVVLVLVTVACCSWAEVAAHLVPALAVLVAHQLLEPVRAWDALAVQVAVLLCCCGVAGRMVRAASAAEVDPLTGLVNRRGAERHLDRAVASAGAGQRWSLAVVDLDHFKAVNDVEGHAAGDELLRSVAHALRWAVDSALGRGSDLLVARWGGDEFVLVAAAPPSELVRALDVARALLPRGTSCSAGVTGLLAGETPSSALARADEALYAVKRSARGRTELAG